MVLRTGHCLRHERECHRAIIQTVASARKLSAGVCTKKTDSRLFLAFNILEIVKTSEGMALCELSLTHICIALKMSSRAINQWSLGSFRPKTAALSAEGNAGFEHFYDWGK